MSESDGIELPTRIDDAEAVYKRVDWHISRQLTAIIRTHFTSHIITDDVDVDYKLTNNTHARIHCSLRVAFSSIYFFLNQFRQSKMLRIQAENIYSKHCCQTYSSDLCNVSVIRNAHEFTNFQIFSLYLWIHVKHKSLLRFESFQSTEPKIVPPYSSRFISSAYQSRGAIPIFRN